MAHPLAQRYRQLADPIDLPGDWPSLIESWPAVHPRELQVSIGAPVELDALARAAGEPHVEAMRAAGAELFDGRVLALAQVGAGQMRAAPCGFFDYLRSTEALAAEGAAPGATPLRDRIDACGQDPLHNGAGRLSAFASCAVLVWDDAPGGPQFALGRRSGQVVGAGNWQIVPAGMCEPERSPFCSGLRRELPEEVSLTPEQEREALSGASVLGLSFNLQRLTFGLISLVRVSGARPRLRCEEHSELRWWPFSDAGLAGAMADIGPGGMAASCGGALELARRHLA